ncbi:aldo/keto reductase [Niabella sp. CC-SYL272]|uniref:aldo/keto reductase n=1 Tax=Niabella agricola TaxID=2891571 RepID=UPI001F457D9F|nr:aldo/keto reductase [Niabella agricola]MCF3107405.1 aldo/keto reductase [Niabella agricola]
MEYRKLGDTNLELSVITHGAFAIGGHMWGGNEKQDSINSIHASLDHGVTSIDTAPFYGFGLSEALVGDAIKGKDRSRIQLLTKFGLVWDGSNKGKGVFFFEATDNGNALPVYKYASRENVIKETEASLTRLGTDYIDLLQLHWPDASTPISETMEALELLIQQGKIRAAGVSNYDIAQLQEAAQTLKPASNQVSYSMLNRSIEKDLVPYALETHTGIIAYSPMERGLLTGKYFKEHRLTSDDHRNGYFTQFDLEKVKTLLQSMEPIARNKGATLAQLVLRWTTLQPGISVVLAGARNAAQAIANAEAINLELNPEELQLIHQQLAGLQQHNTDHL